MTKEEKTKSEGRTVSLVLGSGGARGLAHIGVIKYLEENNFQIKSISGCSIGSLIGGVYAAGKLDELEKWMRSIDKVDMASLLDLSWGNGGVFKGDKIIDTLIDLIGDVQIEEMPIPFTAVAANIETEKEVWFNSGSLFDAIRASVSLPLFFTPFEHQSELLIDGGILNPVPISPTTEDETDLTIAVNLGGAPESESESESENESESESESDLSFQDGIKKFLKRFQNDEDTSESKKWGMYEVANKSLDTMQGAIARYKLAECPPDIEIKIARNACGTYDFDRAKEMIQLGYEKAESALRQN
ncbi:patatin-like phospholipase family protein [Salibacteraceae bacterium]|nr:patatin-like phospholipase family protein [Salibacteraceae bacterium]